MAYGNLGVFSIVEQPKHTSSINFRPLRPDTSYRCANSPIFYRVRYTNGGFTERNDPSAANATTAGVPRGDIINVRFDIYEGINTTVKADMVKIASIRKQRDLPNTSQFDKNAGGGGVQQVFGHTFSLDISDITKDLVNYSLLPLGKGTWTSSSMGGLNGGLPQQDNLNLTVDNNKFIHTKNGSYRIIRVDARAEIIDSTGIVRTTTTPQGLLEMNPVFVFNCIEDYDSSDFLAVNPSNVTQILRHDGFPVLKNRPQSYMTRCPNGQFDLTDTLANRLLGIQKAKLVTMTDNTEQLQWWQKDGNSMIRFNSPPETGTTTNNDRNEDNSSDIFNDLFIQVDAYNKNGVLLRSGRLYDWTIHLKRGTHTFTNFDATTGVSQNTTGTIADAYERDQNVMTCQNVSPVYINANIIATDSTVKKRWEDGGTTYTRKQIDDSATANAENALFLNDEVFYYRTKCVGKTSSDGAATSETFSNLHEYRWFKIHRGNEQKKGTGTGSTESSLYAGVVYSDLVPTLPTNVLRAKGLLYNYPKAYFKIYWLNRYGGIDCYTFKGNNKVFYENNKTVIQRNKQDRTRAGIGYSNQGGTLFPIGFNTGGSYVNVATDSIYDSDTRSGADVHRGQREVINSETDKKGSIQSLPIPSYKAEWLREILSSPNVWTEVQQVGHRSNAVDEAFGVFWQINNRLIDDTSSPLYNGGINQDGRTPSNRNYVPIIITNSTVDVIDDSKSLIVMSFDYTHAHPVISQRN